MKVAVSPRILAQLARSPTLNTQAYDAFTPAANCTSAPG